MRVELAALFTPENEEQLDAIIEGVCDVMRDHGFGSSNPPQDDDEVKSIVTVKVNEYEDIEKFLEDKFTSGAYASVSVPTNRKVMVVPVGQANEKSEVQK